MITLPITGQAKQKEWNIILTIAKNNGFPLQIIHKIKNKIILKTQKTKVTPTKTQETKKWVTFTYHSPLIHKVTNLLKNTDLNIAVRTYNTIYNQCRDKIPLNKVNSSGLCRVRQKNLMIFKLQ